MPALGGRPAGLLASSPTLRPQDRHPCPKVCHLPPKYQCRPFPTLGEGLCRVRSSEKGNRMFFINRPYLIFKR